MAGSVAFLAALLAAVPFNLTFDGIHSGAVHAKGGSGGNGGAGGGGGNGNGGGDGGGNGNGNGGNGNGNGGGAGNGNGGGNGNGNGGGSSGGGTGGTGGTGGGGSGSAGIGSSGSAGAAAGSGGDGGGAALMDDASQVERGQVRQSALSARAANPSPSPIRGTPTETRQIQLWPELSQSEFRHADALRRQAPAKVAHPVESDTQTSWLNSQVPLAPLAIPLWNVVKETSTLIPDSWRPYLTSPYVLWSALLLLVLYPLWRVGARELAYRREERDLFFYD
ncbi:MAG: hypothetical protein AB7M05_18055 [Alphaproteobacteria bacterium]